MALRRPSQHSIDLYNKLVEQQNKVRRRLLRIHKKAEEAIPVGRLPALIIPKKARKITNKYFEVDKMNLKRKIKAFWKKYNQAKEFFGQGIKSYLSRTLKDGYLELWRNQMQEQLGIKPEGGINAKVGAWYFSPSQLQEMNEEERKIAQIYNFLARLSPEVFLALLYRGKLLQFQFIYEEMRYGARKEYSWIDQQVELLEPYRSRKVQAELLRQDEILRDEEMKTRVSTREKGKINSSRELTNSGEHESETLNKAEKMRKRREK